MALVIIALVINKAVEKQIDLNGFGIPIFLFLAMGIWIYRVITTLNSLEKDENKDA